MATDFYERQYQARKTTKWLVGVFIASAVTILAVVVVLAWFAVNEFDPGRALDAQRLSASLSGRPQAPPIGIPAGAAVATLAMIGGGSLFKVAQLRGGGHVVAEQLGGRRLLHDSATPVERRLLNVVEEMALASGVPVPPVFILPSEQAINAFAAGYAPSDAVVAVTQGCAEQLSRDELQGVVAHEFSHILNGDMRLNIRMIGILHGLLVMGLVGRFILRMAGSGTRTSRRRSRDGDSNNGGGYVLLIGLAFFVLGYLGTFLGGLIKAAVSRQREYLADASAVQFTRNPGGIAGALKRIGALSFGSKVQAPAAAEASHMFFAQGVWEGFTSLMATHPPLRSRILAIDPQWDGKFPAVPEVPPAIAELHGHVSGLVGNEVPVSVVNRAADQVGEPTEDHRDYAATLLENIPPLVLQSVREPYGARAVLYALLTDQDAEVQATQLATLRNDATPDVFELTLRLLPAIAKLDVRVRLPLVDLALPSLRAMSESQYRDFINCFKALVAADNRLGLFEWTLHRILLRHLSPQFENNANKRQPQVDIRGMAGPCSVLLSTLAYADNRVEQAGAAVERGDACLPGLKITLLPQDQCGLQPLREALDQLVRVHERQRKHIVNAAAATICADREVTVAEAELLRGICDMLDCPMPPLLPGGPAIAPGKVVAS